MMKLSVILVLTILALLVLISEQTAQSGQRRQRSSPHRQSLRYRNVRSRNGRLRNNFEESSQVNTRNDRPAETPENQRNDNADAPSPTLTRSRQNNERSSHQILQKVRQLAANRRISRIRARGANGFRNVHVLELVTTRDRHDKNFTWETERIQNAMTNETQTHKDSSDTSGTLIADNTTYPINSNVDRNQSTGTGQITDNYANVTQNDTESKIVGINKPRPLLDYGKWLAHERKKQTRILMITTHILRELKLNRQPNVTIPVLPDGQREQMINFMKKIGQGNKRGGQNGNGHDVTKRYHCHVPSCELPRKSDESWEDKGSFRLYFDLAPPEGVKIQVSSAILRLFKKRLNEDECDCKRKKIEDNPSVKQQRAHAQREEGDKDEDELHETNNSEDADSLKVTIHQYTRPVRKNKRIKTKKVPVAEKLISSSYEGWVRFDIKSAVSDWIKNPNRNYGLMVKVHGARNPYQILEPWNCTAGTNETNRINCKFSIVFPGKGNVNLTDLFDDNATHPSLQVLTTEYPQKAPRQRRQIAEVRSIRRVTVAQGSGSCRFVPFTVDLGAMDRYSWIIAPRLFRTGFCVGQCGMQNTTSYTCGPSEVDGLSMLYITGNGSVVLTRMPGMVVKQCGCPNTGG